MVTIWNEASPSDPKPFPLAGSAVPMRSRRRSFFSPRKQRPRARNLVRLHRLLRREPRQELAVDVERLVRLVPRELAAELEVVQAGEQAERKVPAQVGRDPVHAPASPMAVPIVTRSMPSFITNPRTLPRGAPRAMRIPISRRRCATEYAVIPARPTDERTSPNTPMKP